MDTINVLEIVLKVLSIGGALVMLVLAFEKQKSIIARNRCRIEKVENDLEKLEDIAQSLIAAANNTQIKLNHVENFLDRSTDFAPVITPQDFEFGGRYK